MKITNKRVFHDMEILDTFETGVQLLGSEVKSVKAGHISLDGSFAKIVGREVYLINAQIFPYSYARPEGYDAKRSRRLLLHKHEILTIKMKLASNRLTLVPLECYTTHGLVKLKIALAKGKKQYEKREVLKKRDVQRDVARIFRGKI